MPRAEGPGGCLEAKHGGMAEIVAEGKAGFAHQGSRGQARGGREGLSPRREHTQVPLGQGHDREASGRRGGAQHALEIVPSVPSAVSVVDVILNAHTVFEERVSH